MARPGRHLPDAPPAWKPRRGYHYRNLVVFVGFLCLGLGLIIAGALTIPRERPSETAVSRGSAETAGEAAATTTSPGTVAGEQSTAASDDATIAPVPTTSAAPVLDRSVLRTNPMAFFQLPLARESACTAPPSTAAGRKAWLRSTLDTLLSFGTRIAGSESSGFKNAHHMITRLSHCDDEAAVGSRHWTVWHDNSTQDTPLGRRSFSNIIGEMNHPPRNPDGSRPSSLYGPKGHLLVSAHFDSMITSSFEFLGACDSASPVAMMLLMMRELAAAMRAANVDATSYNRDFPAFTFIFFDGEEAFVRWQGTDNTYGSRNLAQHYESNGDISTIDVFLLLDLLGPARPTLHNYFNAATGFDYNRLRTIEAGLISGGQRRTSSASRFLPLEANGYASRIEDDHIPWLQRGVPVLHMIPLPFPPNWHQAGDDGSNIDDDTAADLYDIFVEFAKTFDASASTTRRRRLSRKHAAQSANKAHNRR